MRRHCLFVYGTLLEEDCLRTLLQCVPVSIGATLEHYRRFPLAGRRYPGIRFSQNCRVQGRLLTGLSRAHIRKLDRYEGSEYRRTRVRVTVGGGRQVAWTYVIRRVP